MHKHGLIILVLATALFTISGCATCRKGSDLEVQGLKNQVSLLESQLSAKDEEINSLRNSLNKASEQAQSIIAETEAHPANKDIQVALANAGFDPGEADGKIGRKTRDAIKAFQKANNLRADGRVGKKTWDLLKEYLTKRVK